MRRGHRAQADETGELGQPSFLTRVLHLLAEERRFHGHGKAVKIDRRVGRRGGYVGRVLRGEVGLQVEMLGNILDALEIDAADFLTRVVGTRLEPARVLRRLERKNPRGQGRAPLDCGMLTRLERWVGALAPASSAPSSASSSAASEGEAIDAKGPGTGSAEELARLAERLFSEPEATADEIRRRFVNRWEVLCHRDTITADERVDLARWLGLLGSVERIGQSFHEAALCLRLALELLGGVERAGQARGEAELLRHGASLLASQGEPEVAKLMLRQAIDHGILGGVAVVGPGPGDPVPLMGQLLIQQGGLALRQGDPTRARDAFEAGLAYLPSEAAVGWTWRFTAELGLAQALFAVVESEPGRDPQPVQQALGRARQAHRTRRGPGWWSLYHQAGLVAGHRGDDAAAEKALRTACDGFARGPHKIDQILAHLDLGALLWRTGQHEALRKALACSFIWLNKLRPYPEVCRALHLLARATLTGEVEPAQLRHARVTIARDCGGTSVLARGWMV